MIKLLVLVSVTKITIFFVFYMFVALLKISIYIRQPFSLHLCNKELCESYLYLILFLLNLRYPIFL